MTLWAPNTSWTLKNDFCCLLLLCLAFPFVAQAQTDRIEARLTSPALIDTTPGKIVTASFLLSNHTASDQEFVEELLLPAGWQQIAPTPIPFSLKGKAQHVRLVAFAVPNACPSGRYHIKYIARSRTDHSLGDGGSFSVVVLPFSRLELVLEDKPQMVIAGEAYSVKVRLANRGNGANRFQLSLKSSPEYPVRPPGASILLPPNASTALVFQVTTDPALKKKLTHVLTFNATAEGLTNAELVSASESLGVEILPHVTGELDPYHRIPARLRFAAAQEDGKAAGAQAELSGAGPLSEDGKRHLSFLFRGPDLREQSIFAERDEYRLSYHAPAFDLHLGDRIYSLSPLTEEFGYGRGIGLDARKGAVGAGAFYMRSRWSAHEFEEAGVYVKQDFSPSFGLKANFLHKTGTQSLFTNNLLQNIFTLESRLTLGPVANATVEYGFSGGDRLSAGDHHAVRAKLTGQLGQRVNYALESVFAGPEFYGRFNDSRGTFGSLTFPIYKTLRGSFSGSHYDNNLDRNPHKSSLANREHFFRPGLLYTFPFGSELAAEYQHFRREDLLLPADYDSHERSARLILGHSFRQISLQYVLELGELDQHVPSEQTLPVERHTLSIHCRPTPRQSYSLFTTTGNNRYSTRGESSQSLGASAQWRIKDKVAASLHYSKGIQNAAVTREHDTAHASLGYTFPNRSIVALNGRWSRNSGIKNSESSVFLSYTIPFGLPVKKKTTVGTLKGKVFAAQPGGPMPLARVVLTVGDATAVTDRNGEFIFPALPPGLYALGIAQNSIGVENTTADPLPLMVEVKKARILTVEIRVVPAAHLSVRAARFAKPSEMVASALAATNATPPRTEPGEFNEAGPLEGVLVEISNPKEQFRQFTDRKGLVSFEHLRPGKWSLNVYDNNLPPHHYVEQSHLEVHLTPGENKELTARILPRVRRIQLIDQGVLK